MTRRWLGGRHQRHRHTAADGGTVLQSVWCLQKLPSPPGELATAGARREDLNGKLQLWTNMQFMETDRHAIMHPRLDVNKSHCLSTAADLFLDFEEIG